MNLIPKTNFDFVGTRWKMFAFSGVLLGGTAVSLATKGLVYGIDFIGGTALQITFAQPVDLARLRDAVESAGVPDASIQSFRGTNTFSIRLKADAERSAADIERTVAGIQQGVGDNKLRVESQEYVGPAVGKHLFRQAMWAVILSMAGIVAYVAFRFANPIWGIAGVIALAHDVFATVGLFSIFGSEVDLLIVSALLTIAGYSINDTIVIFDRMREKMRLMRHEPLELVINQSINETLSRTLITNGLVFIVVTILFLLGGKVIHNFAMAMVFGSVIGTYSTIAIAAPMVFEWYARAQRGRAAAAPAPIRPQKGARR